MDNPNVKVRYDSFSDILEVAWEHEDGYFTETDDDRVLERFDVKDNTTGFMIENASLIDRDNPVNVTLGPPRPKPHVTSQEAAREASVTQRRMQQLLAAGRVKGAVRFGRNWAIPSPLELLPGTRGPAGVAGKRIKRPAD